MEEKDNERAITLLTCKEDFDNPRFPAQHHDIVKKLHRLVDDEREKDLEVTKINSEDGVEVTFNIPEDAARRLRRLAETGDDALRQLGILSVQMKGDQMMNLTLTAESTSSSLTSHPSKVTTTSAASPQPSSSSGVNNNHSDHNNSLINNDNSSSSHVTTAAVDGDVDHSVSSPSFIRIDSREEGGTTTTSKLEEEPPDIDIHVREGDNNKSACTVSVAQYLQNGVLSATVHSSSESDQLLLWPSSSSPSYHHDPCVSPPSSSSPSSSGEASLSFITNNNNNHKDCPSVDDDSKNHAPSLPESCLLLPPPSITKPPSSSESSKDVQIRIPEKILNNSFKRDIYSADEDLIGQQQSSNFDSNNKRRHRQTTSSSTKSCPEDTPVVECNNMTNMMMTNTATKRRKKNIKRSSMGEESNAILQEDQEDQRMIIEGPSETIVVIDSRTKSSLEEEEDNKNCHNNSILPHSSRNGPSSCNGHNASDAVNHKRDIVVDNTHESQCTDQYYNSSSSHLERIERSDHRFDHSLSNHHLESSNHLNEESSCHESCHSLSHSPTSSSPEAITPDSDYVDSVRPHLMSCNKLTNHRQTDHNYCLSKDCCK